MVVGFILCLGMAFLIIKAAKKKGESSLGWVLAGFVILCAFLLSVLVGIALGIIIEIILLLIPKREEAQGKPRHTLLYTILGIATVILIIFSVMAAMGNAMYMNL